MDTCNGTASSSDGNLDFTSPSDDDARRSIACDVHLCCSGVSGCEQKNIKSGFRYSLVNDTKIVVDWTSRTNMFGYELVKKIFFTISSNFVC